MNELLKILNDLDDSIDWEKETNLIDDRLLDSFDFFLHITIQDFKLFPAGHG